MSNSLPTPVASMQVTLKTGDQRTKCLPEPDAAPHNKTKSKQQQQKQKKCLPEPDAAPNKKRTKTKSKQQQQKQKMST